MIIDISNTGFKKIFNDKQFELPIRWDGGDYAQFLKVLYDGYLKNLCKNSSHNNCKLFYEIQKGEINFNNCSAEECIVSYIKDICDGLIETVKIYDKGLPSAAYEAFDKVMKRLIKKPIQIYQKSGWTDAFDKYDPLRLYRVVNVNEDTIYPRSRVFHTPYNLRSKVSTSRYSIAGYPSLYLGTCVDLCLKELKCNPQRKLSLCSRFQIDRNSNRNDYQIGVIELAIKPQDFFEENYKHKNLEDNNDRINKGRYIEPDLLINNDVRVSYLLWYPLIAACSFIRAHKSDPFAPEYVIPQLLMQWLRSWNENNNELFGLRYFSCASKLASDMGFNYVFPTSGEEHSKIENYCKVLVDSFMISIPAFIHEYNSVEEFEDYLNNLPIKELDYIYR